MKRYRDLMRYPHPGVHTLTRSSLVPPGSIIEAFDGTLDDAIVIYDMLIHSDRATEYCVDLAIDLNKGLRP